VVGIAWVDAIAAEDHDNVNGYLKGELLLLDADRILALRRQFDAWVSIACVLDVMASSRFSDLLMREIAKALFFSSEERSIEALLQIAMGTVTTTDVQEDVARVVVTAMVSSTQDLLDAAAALSSMYRQRLRNCLLSAVCGTGRVVTENVTPLPEAFAHAMQTPHVDLLVNMVSISKHVHEDRYVAMIVSCA
jgi:hypothetical protein